MPKSINIGGTLSSEIAASTLSSLPSTDAVRAEGRAWTSSSRHDTTCRFHEPDIRGPHPLALLHVDRANRVLAGSFPGAHGSDFLPNGNGGVDECRKLMRGRGPREGMNRSTRCRARPASAAVANAVSISVLPR